MRTSTTTRLFLLLALLAALAATPADASAQVTWDLGSYADTAVSPLGKVTVTTERNGSAAPATDELQRLGVIASSGTYLLSYSGQSTPELPHSASASEVQGALEALPAIGAGNVEVIPTLLGTGPYEVAFGGALASQDLPQLEAEPGPQPLGGLLRYHLQLRNLGTEPSDGSPLRLAVSLPAGMTGVEAITEISGFGCPSIAGLTAFTCEGTPVIPPFKADQAIVLTVAVVPAAAGTLTTTYDLEGGGGAPLHTVDPTVVTPVPPEFGFDAFDLSARKAGAPYLQAAGRPEELVTAIDFASETNSAPIVGDVWPVEDVRDAKVELPPGLVGATATLGQCTRSQLANGDFLAAPLCPMTSQVGVVDVRIGGAVFSPLPLYNLVPPPGTPARFGFNLGGSLIALDAHVRTGGDYGIDVGATNLPQAIAIAGNTVTFWGTPADPSHDPQRQCPGERYLYEGTPNGGSEACPFDDRPAPTAILRNPTSCGPLAATARIDSWQDPGDVKSSTVSAHADPGYPAAPSQWGAQAGTEGCAAVPFEPAIALAPTSHAADSPTGLEVDLSLPQTSDPEALATSDLRNAVVTLPKGMAVNPSSANGLGACSSAQIALDTEAEPACPDNSKIGEVAIETPLLDEEVKGAVYLASQGDNKFGSLLAVYLVARSNGVLLKLAGKIEPKEDGQLVTRFEDQPQLPFSRLHLTFYGGQRAALRTPPSCGSHTSTAELTGWSGAKATISSSFTIDEGCGAGFDPKLEAGTENPFAGDTSPFNLRLTRSDASPELGGLSVSLPPGLSGYLKGIPYCPDAVLAGISAQPGTGRGQEASPSCPAASQVGKVTVGAGSGANPFYTSAGRAYLAGPYKGAPLSLAVVAPAVAGPFDLGSVVVRNAVRVDPRTAQLRIDSDPLPHILQGIPLDLRDVRVAVDRDHFTLNPTSCEPMQVSAAVTSVAGAGATPSVHFQAAGCDRLGFKPKLSLRLKGGSKRRGHPALTAVLRPRAGDANAAQIQVALPHSEFLAQSHIRTICTRVQFAADSCPPGSVYGRVTAVTPILDQPLTGNVYLRSSDHPLPDMVLSLHGPPSQPIAIEAVGRIDSINGGLRTTFEGLPDAPLTKVTLRLPAGRKSLLENSTNICRGRHRAQVDVVAQNNRLQSFKAPLKARCGKGNGKGGHGRRHHRS